MGRGKGTDSSNILCDHFLHRVMHAIQSKEESPPEEVAWSGSIARTHFWVDGYGEHDVHVKDPHMFYPMLNLITGEVKICIDAVHTVTHDVREMTECERAERHGEITLYNLVELQGMSNLKCFPWMPRYNTRSLANVCVVTT